MDAKLKSVTQNYSKTVGISLGNSDGASHCFGSNYAFLVTQWYLQMALENFPGVVRVCNGYQKCSLGQGLHVE